MTAWVPRLLAGLAAVCLALGVPLAAPGSLAITAVALLPILVLAALRWATAALTIAWCAIVFLPVYWGTQPRPGVLVLPVTAIALVLAPAALGELRHLTLGAIDVAVLCFVVLQVTAYVVTFGTLAPALVVLSRVLAPYVVVRLLTTQAQRRDALARAALLSAAVVSVGAVLEGLGAGNPFISVTRVGFEGQLWAHAESRFGRVRVEGPFGHPIALGLYLASALAFALAFIVARRRGPMRQVALLTALVSIVAILWTLSRGAVLAATFVGVVTLVFGSAAVKRRLTPLLVLGGAYLVLGPTSALFDQLLNSTAGSSEAAVSVQYRVRLLELFLDPAQFSWLGRYSSLSRYGAVNSVAEQVGFPSFDNQFALVYLVTGALPLLAFLWICACVFREVVRPRPSLVDRAWAAAAASTVLGLTTVGLLTQQADLFWLSVAVVASARQAALASLASSGRMSSDRIVPAGLRAGAGG